MDTEEVIASGGTMDDIAEIQEDLREISDLAEEATTTNASSSATTKSHDPLAVIHKHHPECILDYTESILQKLPIKAVTSTEGTDRNHKSQPFLTQYEKTSILGFRTNQLAQGARPFVVVPPHITSTLEIARMELEQRRLPFIIKRPMPDSTFEYWRLADLMIL
jgi:DNA-directed RNA polymerase I, II, and III subunit RPABC2